MAQIDGVREEWIDDLWIASIRWYGTLEDAPARFAELRERVAPYISGPAILLHSGESPTIGADLEAAYPVAEGAHAAGVATRALSGGNALVIEHHGVFAPASAENSWRARMAPIRSEILERWLIGNGPRRTVFLNVGDELRKPTDELRVEVHLPLGVAAWVDGLARGVEEEVGSQARASVIGAGEPPAEDAPAAERAAWVRQAIDRLDRAVPDPETRCAILGRCSHVSPEALNEEMRRVYKESGSIDVLLARMTQDKTAGGTSWFEHPQRVGHVIYITKIPFDPEGFKNAKTPLDRRISYCHCTFVREALRAGKTMSPTFCAYGLGWFPPIWESILGVPVRARHVRSLLTGSESCQVAIELPDNLA